MVAYDKGSMSRETRDTILYGQLQDGLRMNLLRSPSVSGSLSYKELCMAAKNEERRQFEQKKKLEYSNSSGSQDTSKSTGRHSTKQIPRHSREQNDSTTESI